MFCVFKNLLILERKLQSKSSIYQKDNLQKDNGNNLRNPCKSSKIPSVVNLIVVSVPQTKGVQTVVLGERSQEKLAAQINCFRDVKHIGCVQYWLY